MVLLHRIGKGIGSAIGLGQEAYAKRQQSKSSDNGPEQYAESKNVFKDSVGPTSDGVRNGAGEAKLPAPVIIPQRRPNTRRRGFLAAYAPALEYCGVDQKTFLEFLDGFRSESEKGAAFNAFNIAVALGDLALEAAELGPSVAMHFAAVAVHLSVEAGKKMYVNKKTNEYLDRMNEDYFRPRRLYAMIMTYDPSHGEVGEEVVDLETHAAGAAKESTRDTPSGKFETSSAKTLEAQIPEVCSLVFPEGDDNDGAEKSGLTKGLEFANDYWDRRSQALYAAHNPESSLNVQEHDFAGRYADPTTFENSGLIGVLTGGAIDPRGRKKARQAAKKPESDPKQERQGLIGSVKGKLQERVLYVLIVNLPSAEEMEVAEKILSRTRESA